MQPQMLTLGQELDLIESIKKVVKSDIVEPIQIDYNKPDSLKDALKDVDITSYLPHFNLIWWNFHLTS